MVTCTGSIVLANGPSAAFYRYTTADGRTEVGRHVPPAAIEKGYEVLDKRMRLIRVVDRAPSAAELQSKRSAEHQHAMDEKLLQTFATTADAQRARDRKIAALDVIVNISKGNILRLNLEFETLAALAAGKARRGLPIPQRVSDNMNSIERQIEEAESHIALKEKEKQSIFDSYKEDIERLQAIEAEHNEQARL